MIITKIRKKKKVQKLMTIPCQNTMLNDYCRVMDTIANTLESIEEFLFYDRRNQFSNTELVFFDTTSMHFEKTRES